MKSSLLFSVLVAMAAITSPAKADLLVSGGNGGFETGDFTDWTPTNLDKNSGVFMYSVNTGSIHPHTGTFYASLSNDGSNGHAVGQILQASSTTNGANYDLSFWAYIEASTTPGVSFQAYWDATPLLNIQNPAVSPDMWVHYDFAVTGTGTDTVKFVSGNKPRYNGLDDVTLTAVPLNTDVPGNLTTCGIAAVVGLGICGYRRRLATRA